MLCTTSSQPETARTDNLLVMLHGVYDHRNLEINPAAYRCIHLHGGMCSEQDYNPAVPIANWVASSAAAA